MGETNGSNIVGAGGGEPSWEELLGSNNWDGLLDPLDLSLRRFLLRCGDFAECAGDAFNDDKFTDGRRSPYYGTSRYGEKSFFHRVKFEFADDYEVSSLLYVTSTDPLDLSRKTKETNYIGYVAVSSDAASARLGRREIHVALRGTKSPDESLDDLEFLPVPVTPLLRAPDPAPPKVMHGWLDMYTASNPSSEATKLSLREQVQGKINQLRQDYKDEKNLSIAVTGHSMGSSLAVLAAFDLVENGVSGIPVAALVFACPNVGDLAFAERLGQYPNLKILHTKNKLDPVPNLPPQELGYRPVGVTLQLDGKKSTYIKEKVKNTEWHNLQGMLHMVAGWHGQEAPFVLVVERSVALLNRTDELLKDEYNIPGNWWAVENKGMLLNHKGDWILAPPLQED